MSNTVSISKEEYQKLKRAEKIFGNFLIYSESLNDIREARKQVAQKKVISQEKLFKKLGL